MMLSCPKGISLRIGSTEPSPSRRLDVVIMNLDCFNVLYLLSNLAQVIIVVLKPLLFRILKCFWALRALVRLFRTLLDCTN